MKNDRLNEWKFRTGQIDEVMREAFERQESCFEQLADKKSVQGSTIRDYLDSAQKVTTAFELCGIYYPPGKSEATVWIGGSGFGVRHLPAQRTFKYPKFENDDLGDILSIGLGLPDSNQSDPDSTASLKHLRRLAQFSQTQVLDDWWKRHQALDEYKSVYTSAYAVYQMEVFDYADKLAHVKEWMQELYTKWEHFKTMGLQRLCEDTTHLPPSTQPENDNRNIYLEDNFPKGEQVIQIDMANNATVKPPFGKLSKPIKLLYLAATPKRLGNVNTGLESRFQDLIREYDSSDKIDFKQEHGLSKERFRNELYTQDPHILHFGGHGFTEGLALEDADIDAEVLVELISMLTNTQIVVLNACNTLPMAREMAKYVPYVIGTQGPLADNAAIAFARSFYVGVASGKDIEGAFHFGLNGIKDLDQKAHNIPVLVKGVNKSRGAWPDPESTSPTDIPADDIPALVAEGMLREALAILEKKVPDYDLNLVFQIKGQLSQLERDIISSTISESTANISRAKIRQAILMLQSRTIN